MAFRDFRLVSIEQQITLKFHDSADSSKIRGNINPVAPSALFAEKRKLNEPLDAAIGNEKARSEFIIAPVLMELKRCFSEELSLFSGIEF